MRSLKSAGRAHFRRCRITLKTADIENLLAGGKYTECYDLVEQGDIELAIAKIEALAVERQK